MNEGKRQNLRMYFVCNALGYRLMQLAARGGNEGLHTFGAEAISLLLAIGYIRCPQGVRVRILFVETRNESVVKVSPSNNQPTNQPSNPPTNHQSKKKPVSPGWSKEWHKETFFSRA
jgi:hypothetical protein